MPWAPQYVDDEDLADFVRVNADNPYVGTYGLAASRAVDEWCDRQFGRLDAPATFTYPGHRVGALRSGRWLLMTDDIPATADTVVTVAGSTVAAGADGYTFWPPDAIAKGSPHLGIVLADRPARDADVAVTNRFGWLATPAAVTAAIWLQVNAWNIRRESPFGTAGGDADQVSVTGSRRLDPDARAMLSPLVRRRMPQ